MKQTDTEKMLQNDPELDALLDQMAEDVPPMPADFHDNWMSAIRTEAKQAAPAAEEKEEKKPVSIVRWTRILSVAAMFVFLIGGTLLYRNTKGTMRLLQPWRKRQRKRRSPKPVIRTGMPGTCRFPQAFPWRLCLTRRLRIPSRMRRRSMKRRPWLWELL